jgi:ATP-dependent DNA ligase
MGGGFGQVSPGCRALVADGFEGTVAKRTTGRYRCGKRSNAWVKLKSQAARYRDRRRVMASLAA